MDDPGPYLLRRLRMTTSGLVHRRRGGPAASGVIMLCLGALVELAVGGGPGAVVLVGAVFGIGGFLAGRPAGAIVALVAGIAVPVVLAPIVALTPWFPSPTTIVLAWVVGFLIAAGLIGRAAPWGQGFGTAECASLAIAGAVAIAYIWKMDPKAEGTALLLTAEDNAAWVSMAGRIVDQMQGVQTPFADIVLGYGSGVPVVASAMVRSSPHPELLGSIVLLIALVAVLLAPLAAGVLATAIPQRSRIATLAVTIAASGMALGVAVAFATLGHLSAAFAFAAGLLAIALVQKRWVSLGSQAVVCSLLVSLVALMWFPFIPVAVGVIAVLGAIMLRARCRRSEIAPALAAQAVMLVSLGTEFRSIATGFAGSASGGGLVGGLVGGLSTVFQQGGGTLQRSDSFTLAVLVLAGLAAYLGLERGVARAAAWGSLVVLVYAFVVAAVDFAQRAAFGYGTQKLWFISSAWLLVTATLVIASQLRSRAAVLALGVAVLMVDVGGGGTFVNLLARTWPPKPIAQSWVGAAYGVRGVTPTGSPPPVVCLDPTNPQVSYLCTRFSSAIVGNAAGFGVYAGAALAGDATAQVDSMRRDGMLGRTTVIQLAPLGAQAPAWQRALIGGAGRVITLY